MTRLWARCLPATVLNWNLVTEPAEEELSGVAVGDIPGMGSRPPEVTQPEDILL